MSSDGPSETLVVDHATSVFIGLRRRLFGIAYRMFGSVTEAEDIVQGGVDPRWQAADCDAVLDPAAFLAKTTPRFVGR